MYSGGTLLVSVVCEGKTDLLVIEAALESVLDEDFVIAMIQPELSGFAGSDYGEMGSGWKGVRKWCQNMQERHGDLQSAVQSQPLVAYDLLVLHVDADIAGHSQIDVEQPCPPASDTVNALQAVVLDWCGDDTAPDGVVLCIPSKAIEAWIFAALHSEDRLCNADLECRPNPQTLLVGKVHKLVRRKDGQYRKNTSAYTKAQGEMTAGWHNATRVCGEAQRFEENVAAAIAERLE